MDPRDAKIDEALRSYPLQPLPAGWSRRVMAQVRADARAARPRPLFRLDFVDISVPTFIALFLTALAAGGSWMWQAVDPLARVKAQLWAYSLWLQVSASPLFPLALVSLVGLAFLVLGSVCLGVWLSFEGKTWAA